MAGLLPPRMKLMPTNPFAANPLGHILFWRYTRFIVNTISSWNFKPIPLPEGRPNFTSEDVTVIIPTICGKNIKALGETLHSILATAPWKVMVVTVDRDRDMIQEFVKSIDEGIEVYSVRYPNKRRQISCALGWVETPITILADDDVLWPSTLMPYILAPFEDAHVGAVGTRQVVRRQPGLSLEGKIWEYLGAAYIERRNFEITATSNIDGGISCLSGRTGAYRTAIIHNSSFTKGYSNEKWAGKKLNPDDDNFITRWLYSHGWKIAIQSDERALVQTTLECNRSFLKQCLRWCRSNWRSNYTSTVLDRTVWAAQPWSTYALHLATPTCSLVTDPVILLCTHSALVDHCLGVYWSLFCLLILWMLLAKVTKLLPMYRRRPSDVFFLPVSLVFGYLHGFIKYYALLTVGETGWGTRPDYLGPDATDHSKDSGRLEDIKEEDAAGELLGLDQINARLDAMADSGAGTAEEAEVKHDPEEPGYTTVDKHRAPWTT